MHTHPPEAPLPAATSPWRPPALIQASVAHHAAAAAALVAMPGQWPWIAGSLALNHAVLTAAGLWPRSTCLGQNMLRLPPSAARLRQISITLDDGPDPEVTPAVLDLLDVHGAKATFFCIAGRARQHAALCREIVRRGHSVQNHSRDHSHNFSLLGPTGLRREIGAAQQILTEITGQAPRFFRAPAGLRNPLLAPVLHRLGLTLVSWSRRGYDTVQRHPAKVLARLTAGLRPGAILVLHDGNAARSADRRPVVLEVLPALLRECEAQGLRPATLDEAAAPPVHAAIARTEVVA
ncbi:MAG: polysaccharide deacetylase family protein [Rhizobacter sp.]